MTTFLERLVPFVDTLYPPPAQRTEAMEPVKHWMCITHDSEKNSIVVFMVIKVWATVCAKKDIPFQSFFFDQVCQVLPQSRVFYTTINIHQLASTLTVFHAKKESFENCLRCLR